MKLILPVSKNAVAMSELDSVQVQPGNLCQGASHLGQVSKKGPNGSSPPIVCQTNHLGFWLNPSEFCFLVGKIDMIEDFQGFMRPYIREHKAVCS